MARRGSGKPRCRATSKRTGNRCGQYPAAGAAVCKWHGAGAPQVVAAARRRLLANEALADLVRLGVAVECTPIEALEAMLWEAAGNVAVLRSMVAELARDELYGPKYVYPEFVVDDDGEGVRVALAAKGQEQTALPHVLVVMYDAERDRLARIARDCAALGLDERRIALAEAAAERLFAALRTALDRAGLAPEMAAAVRLGLAQELRAA